MEIKKTITWVLGIVVVILGTSLSVTISAIATQNNKYIEVNKKLLAVQVQNEFLTKQLEEQKTQITLLRGSFSQEDITQNVEVKNVRFDKPEELLKAYLEAVKWQDRVSLVLEPESAYKIMAQEYSAGLFGGGYKPPQYYYIHPISSEVIMDEKGENLTL